MNKRLLTLLAFSLTFSSVLVAQDLYYDAFFRGDRVGYMKVSQSNEGEKTIARSETKLTVSMLLSVDLLVQFETEFRNGNMVKSNATSYRDGELNGQSIGWRSGVSYIVNQDGERKTVVAPSIDRCVTTIHWMKPEGQSQIYSERWGQFLKVTKESDGRYGLHLPNGDVNYYRYSGNVATSLEVNHGWFSMEFKLRG